jgi:hypothetical protein
VSRQFAAAKRQIAGAHVDARGHRCHRREKPGWRAGARAKHDRRHDARRGVDDRLKDLPADGGFALLLLLGLAMIGPLFSQSAWNNVPFTAARSAIRAEPCRAP